MRFILLSALLIAAFTSEAQKKNAPATSAITYDQSLYSGIRWREVGPFRGGRSGTVTGVPGKCSNKSSVLSKSNSKPCWFLIHNSP